MRLIVDIDIMSTDLAWYLYSGGIAAFVVYFLAKKLYKKIGGLESALLHLISYAGIRTYSWICIGLLLIKSLIPTFLARRKYMTSIWDFDSFWRHCMYSTQEDCWCNVVKDQPGTSVLVNSTKVDPELYWKRQLPEKYNIVINSGSYNYGGFANEPLQITPSNYPSDWFNDIMLELVEKMVMPSPNMAQFLSSMSGYARLNFHERMEKKIAQHLGLGDALAVPTGYGCNFSVIPEIIGCMSEVYGKKPVLVLSDSENHASIVRGLMGAQNRKVVVFEHNDVDSLDEKFKQNVYQEEKKSNKIFIGPRDLDLDMMQETSVKQYGSVLVVFEGIYSMSGSIANIRDFIRWAHKTEKIYEIPVMTYCDQAHSWGAIGQTGKGLYEYANVKPSSVDFTMVTFSKYPCAIGGSIVLRPGLQSWMTAIKKRVREKHKTLLSEPFCMPEVSIRVIEVLSKDISKRMKRFSTHIQLLRSGLGQLGLQVLGDPASPVAPFIIPDPRCMASLQKVCLQKGLALTVVGYPATPIDSVRARVCLSAGHSKEQVLNIIKILDEVWNDFGLPRFFSASHPHPMVKRGEYGSIQISRVHPNRPDVITAPHAGSSEPDGGSIEYTPNQKWASAIRYSLKDGVGMAGPRGFFGTSVNHVKLERVLAKHYGKEDSILYPGMMMIFSSVLPALFGKKNNTQKTLLVDEALTGHDMNLAIRITGMHADILSPDENPDSVRKYYDCLITTRDGFDEINCPVKIKVGNLQSETVPKSKYDAFITSFETTPFHMVGGAFIGSGYDVDKQRLRGSGYTFSAAIPAFVCMRVLSFFKE